MHAHSEEQVTWEPVGDRDGRGDRSGDGGRGEVGMDSTVTLVVMRGWAGCTWRWWADRGDEDRLGFW